MALRTGGQGRVTTPDQSSNRQVVRNFLSLGGGEAVARLIAFGVTMYLARALGAEGYGVIALAIGVNLYLAKVADFGIETAGTQAIAEAPERLGQIASAVMAARLALGFGLALVAGAIGLLLLPEPERTVLPLYFLTLVPIAASTRWIHIGLQDARPVGVSRIVGELVILALVVLTVHSSVHLWRVPVAQLVGELLVAALLYLVLVRRGEGFSLRWKPEVAGPIFRRGLPLFVQITLGLLIYNSDLLFLRALRNSTTVGYYAAAYALISFVANLGMTYGISLLPTLTRARRDEGSELSLYQTALAQSYAVCLPVAAGAFVLAPQIIELVFGEGYEGSVLALQILAASIPFSTVRNVPWIALVARERGHLLTADDGDLGRREPAAQRRTGAAVRPRRCRSGNRRHRAPVLHSHGPGDDA